MKKLKITNIAFALAALLVEILVNGVKLEWKGMFYETVSYHSYFDLTVWEMGNVGPLLCGIFTSVLLCMLVVGLFVNFNRLYDIATGLIAIVAVVFSLISVFYDSFTLVGLIVTVLLSVSLELCAMMYINKKSSD